MTVMPSHSTQMGRVIAIATLKMEHTEMVMMTTMMMMMIGMKGQRRVRGTSLVLSKNSNQR